MLVYSIWPFVAPLVFRVQAAMPLDSEIHVSAGLVVLSCQAKVTVTPLIAWPR
jgi:hypothetical protein